MKSSRLPSAPLFAASAFAFLLAATLAAPTPAQAQGSPRVLQRAALAPVEGEVIVAFKPDASVMRKHALSARNDPDAVRSVLSQRAASLGSRWGRSLEAGAAVSERAQVMRAVGVDATTLARQLAADPDVLYAVPNGRKRIVTAPNDPLYPASALGVRPDGPDSGQWYLRAPTSVVKSSIDIESAWARTFGAPSVVVAVLDTGVRFEHPDLGHAETGGQLLPGYDMVATVAVANDGNGRDSDPSDPGDWVTTAETTGSTFSGCQQSASSWHGTATASLIAAATNSATAGGMAGAAPGSRVLPVRVLGKCFGVDSDILAGMRWAAGIAVPGLPANPNPAKVINMSLGGSGVCSRGYQDAVDEITARGVTIVAAAGNSVNGPVNEPANCRGVTGVLALRHAGSKVGFSDLGPEISISAPGGNCINVTSGSPCLYPILAATNSGLQSPVSSTWTNSFDITVGTSFSAPLVAGVAALMLSVQPTLPPDRVKAGLQAGARPFVGSGADNGSDPTVVPSCYRTDLTGESGQCYCPNDGKLCGAGMLDAGGAMTALETGVVAKIALITAAPTASSSVQLSSISVPVVDDRIVGFAWSLADGGGIVSRIESSTSGAGASVIPTAAGTFRVRLAVTGNRGGQSSTETSVTVQAAAVLPSAGGGGGGGGASSGAWVAGVALAAAALRALRRRA